LCEVIVSRLKSYFANVGKVYTRVLQEVKSAAPKVSVKDNF